MVDLVSPSGRLVGIDASEVMVCEARRRAVALAAPVTFEVGNALKLPFPDGAFDICRAATLLMHVADAGRVLTEMVRVVRKGGLVAVFDFDWDTMIIDHPDKQTTRTIVLSYSDSLRNGWIGRQLPRLFQERCLEVRSIDPVQVSLNFTMCDLTLGGHLAALQENGMLSAATIQQWWENLQRRRAGDPAGQHCGLHHCWRQELRFVFLNGRFTANDLQP
jgi:SAM-dependent methyltransferase